jgi:hypothetical protein
MIFLVPPRRVIIINILIEILYLKQLKTRSGIPDSQ